MDRSTLEFLQETIIKLKVISQKIKVDLRIPIYAANLFRINLIDLIVFIVYREQINRSRFSKWTRGARGGGGYIPPT